MSTIVSIDGVQVRLTLFVADLVLAMLMIGTVVVEGRIHNISRDTTSNALTNVVSEPKSAIVLSFRVQQSLAVVHEQVCTNADQATIAYFIVATAGHEDVTKVVGVAFQVGDVPVNHRIVDVACVGGHVGEMLEDSVKDSEVLGHPSGLTKLIDLHVFLSVGRLHANSQRFGDIHVLDPMEKELHDVGYVFDVVDEHLLIKAIAWCARDQGVLQVCAHDALKVVAWDGIDGLAMVCKKDG